MDLKITFDVTPALADAAKCLCRALELRSTHAHAEPPKEDAPAKAENLAVEAPEPVDVPKPAPAQKNAAEVKPEATMDVSAPEPAPEPAPETEPIAEPGISPKKRSHRKKADATASEEPAPAPASEEPAPAPASEEPAPAPASEEPAPAPASASEEPAPASAEPAPVQPKAAPADTPNAPTIDDVRAVGVKLGAAGKQSVIIDYLKAHGCKSLSQLDPGCYAELIEIGKAAL